MSVRGYMPEVGVPSRKAMKRRHSFFDTQHDATEARLQNWVRFETRCIFYVFLCGNTQKRSPDVMQLAFVL